MNGKQTESLSSNTMPWVTFNLVPLWLAPFWCVALLASTLLMWCSSHGALFTAPFLCHPYVLAWLFVGVWRSSVINEEKVWRATHGRIWKTESRGGRWTKCKEAKGKQFLKNAHGMMTACYFCSISNILKKRWKTFHAKSVQAQLLGGPMFKSKKYVTVCVLILELFRKIHFLFSI